MQPVVQVVASFPAPMLFPAVVAVLAALGVGLDAGSVAAHAARHAVVHPLQRHRRARWPSPPTCARRRALYRIGTWQRFRELYFPSVFPYLVTGWVTAAGGAWNASIVSEYVSFRGQVLAANGLGARISTAAASGDFAVLAAAIAVMAAMVVLFNRIVWRRLYAVAEERFSLDALARPA